MIKKLTVTALLTLSFNATSAEVNLPDWVTSPGAGEAAYCVDITNGKEKARFAAMHYAALELSGSNSETTVIGNESMQVDYTSQAVSTEYGIEAISLSKADELDVYLVEEVISGDKLCVLVTD